MSLGRRAGWLAPAKDLYTSALWQRRRRHAEASGRPWLILSAEHGLLDPETIIEPYDVALASVGVHQRRVWSQGVFGQLKQRFPSLAGIVFEVHAGAAYVESGLAALLRDAGATVRRPIEGLLFGEQLAWYGGQGVGTATATGVPEVVERAPTPVAGLGTTKATELAEMIVAGFYGGSLDLSARTGAPSPGWDEMPECRAVARMRTGGASGRQVRSFLTFMCAMDRARNAERLH